MKKSHWWQEMVEARCPYCGGFHKYYCVGDKGDIVICQCCGKQFELGKQL